MDDTLDGFAVLRNKNGNNKRMRSKLVAIALVACQENDLGVLDSKFLVALTGPLQEHQASFECFVREILETPVKTFFGHG